MYDTATSRSCGLLQEAEQPLGTNTVVQVNFRHLFTDLRRPQPARQRVLASRSGDQPHDPLPHEQPYNIGRGDREDRSKPRSVATPFWEVPHVPVISRRAEDCASYRYDSQTACAKPAGDPPRDE